MAKQSRAAMSLMNLKRKMILFAAPMLQPQLQRRKTTIGVIQTQGNANNTFYQDVRSMSMQGRLEEALHILYTADQRVDRFIYHSFLQGCLNNKALPEAKLVHAHIIETQFTSQDISLGNKLVTIYAKCGSLVDARRVLDQMPERDMVSWTVMIAAYARHGYGEEALALFYKMQRTGIQPDQFAFASVLPACASLAVLKEVHKEIIRSGFESDVFVVNALVDMYAKYGRVEDARELFNKMPQRDVVSWNAMIAGYAQNGHLNDALELFQKMPRRDVVSWTAMVAGYSQNGYVDEALKLFQRMPERNAVSWNAMIAGYAQNGHVDEALKLFEEMPKRNVVSWNAMIAGYVQNGHADEALRIFRQMQLTGVKPNEKTFASVLPACANLTALEQGKEIHEEIISSQFESDVFVGSALVDMYAKCGSIENARDVFDKMHQRDVVSWTAMIEGYAMHGYGKEALKLFEQMQHSGTNPNQVTLVGVLSACCHAGLVEEGRQYFDCMSHTYHIKPAMEHYGCMVDLLGRAGLLDEAQDLINKMPMTPDASVWRCLLGACRIHNNIELAECLAERLFELDSKNDAPYVLLSNIYAEAGRWDDIERVRKMMKDRRVKKKPGCSWIEVNKQMYAFLAGDRSHPQTMEIYAELEGLSRQMKEAGYVPDKRFVLKDVEEEQKEQILCYHSEKLAIAFGIINMPPQTTIRVIKNLRVCGDCHTAIKFISKIIAREIVIRDANRFHHFKDGQCSCRDYW
eukprot:Gb_22629 [translate_table: standard]